MTYARALELLKFSDKGLKSNADRIIRDMRHWAVDRPLRFHVAAGIIIQAAYENTFCAECGKGMGRDEVGDEDPEERVCDHCVNLHTS